MWISWNSKSKLVGISDSKNKFPSDKIVEVDVTLEAVKKSISAWEAMSLNVRIEVGDFGYASR